MTFAERFKFRILTPATALEDEAEGLIIQKWDGFVGFLPDHIGYVAKIENGILTYFRGEEEFYVATGTGYFRFQNNQALVLVDVAERGENLEILLKKAREREEEEEEIARRAHQAFERARAALLRALEKRKRGFPAGGRVSAPPE